MLSVRSFSILCLITLCVVIAAVLVSGDSDAIPGSGKPLFPDLMSRLNEIEKVEVKDASARFLLEKSDSGWTAPEKFDYPADADKVHKLLVGAAGLNRVEPKTADPARYPKLGLAEADGNESGVVSYRLKSGVDATIAALIVGNSAPAKGDPDLNEFYVRLPGDPRAWLVEGKLPRGGSLIDWLDRTVAAIDRARVRETRVAHASGEVVTVTRESPTQDDFRLVDAPPDKTVDGQWKLNDIGRLFSKLELEDIHPEEEAPITIKGEPDYLVTMETFDGLVVHMKVFEDDEKALATLRAEFEVQESQTGGSLEDRETLLSADEIRDQVKKLNARWAGWAYVLPGFKVDAMARTPSELLKDLSEEEKPEQG